MTTTLVRYRRYSSDRFVERWFSLRREAEQFIHEYLYDRGSDAQAYIVETQPTTPLADVGRSLLPTQKPGLLPCPFCGERERLHVSSDERTPAPGGIPHDPIEYFFVECDTCDGRGGEGDSAVDANNQWNTRVSDSSKEARLVQAYESKVQDFARETLRSSEAIAILQDVDKYLGDGTHDIATGHPKEKWGKQCKWCDVRQRIEKLLSGNELQTDSSKEYVRGRIQGLEDAAELVQKHWGSMNGVELRQAIAALITQSQGEK